MELMTIHFDAFHNASGNFCSYDGCHERAVQPADNIMRSLYGQILYTFPWRYNRRNSRWTCIESEYTLSCLFHTVEWVEHVIAGEVLWRIYNNIPINRKILEICPSTMFRDVVAGLCTDSSFYDDSNDLFENVDIELGVGVFMEPEIDDEPPKPPKRVKTKYESLPLVWVRDSASCVVCYTNDKMTALKCGHNVCFDCLIKIHQTAENKKCPYCRDPWNFKDCKRVKEQFEIIES